LKKQCIIEGSAENNFSSLNQKIWDAKKEVEESEKKFDDT